MTFFNNDKNPDKDKTGDENTTSTYFDAKKELVRELKTYSGHLLLPLDQEDFRLGLNFGIYKWDTRALRDVPSASGWGGVPFAAMDLAAITALCEARQQDLKSFKEKLEKAEQSKTTQPRR